MTFDVSDRIEALPPYLFAEIDRQRSAARARGVDLVDLGVGDPDLPTAPHIVEALCRAATNPQHHRYPAYEGMLRTRQALAAFYARRFGVELDAATEVMTLIGSKEGLAHFPLAVLNPGEVALVPDPAYPVYRAAVEFAGGRAYPVPLLPERGFLPDLAGIPKDVARRAVMLFVNYPNNPTGGTATLDEFQEILSFAEQHALIVVSDLAYSEMFFEDPAPPSMLQLPGARERVIELYSLSKTYNMTGWRVGFAAGNAELVRALGRMKTNVDSGVFGAVQEAAIAAMEGDQSPVLEMRRVYGTRRTVMVEGLRRLGLTVQMPKATFYVFAAVPEGQTSMAFARRLLEEAGVVATPGVGFGPHGEGFVRFALTVPEDRLRLALDRMGKLAL